MGALRRATHRAVQAARAQVGHRSAATRASDSVRVHLTVEPNLVDDITDLLRQVEERAVRNGSVVTVPFPPGRDPARAVTELRRVLSWWRDQHPGISVVVVRSEEGDQDLAAAGRGILAVTVVAQRLGSGRAANLPPGRSSGPRFDCDGGARLQRVRAKAQDRRRLAASQTTPGRTLAEGGARANRHPLWPRPREKEIGWLAHLPDTQACGCQNLVRVPENADLQL
jgi:hypothetical protein